MNTNIDDNYTFYKNKNIEFKELLDYLYSIKQIHRNNINIHKNFTFEFEFEF